MESIPLPSNDAEPARYAGRPLLIVLENYILDCIGELSADKQSLTQKIVQGTFGGGDDWKATVRQQLQFEPKIEDAFRRMWEHNQRIAGEHDQTLLPTQFAKMVADQNFAQLFPAIPRGK